jgi:hypothetical protein
MHGLLAQPHLLEEPVLDADLCDFTVHHTYCQQQGTTLAVDVNGRVRVLCAGHRDYLFPVA